MLKPLNNKIMLQIDEMKIGAIQSDSISEAGRIISTGPNVDKVLFKEGRMLYFKAWAVDIITKDDEKYYFISADSDAICALE